MVIYNGKTKIFYPLGGHQYTLHKCSTLSSGYFHVVCNVMQNKKSPHMCLVFQPDIMEGTNKVSDCKQASWTLFI